MVACKAASINDVEALRVLMSKGVDLNEGDYDNRTPLHIAAGAGLFETVRYLVQAGVNVNPVDRWGATPMNDAYSYPDMKKFLASIGGKIGKDLPY